MNCNLRTDDEIIDDVIETIRNVASEAIHLPVVLPTAYYKEQFFKRTAEKFYFYLSERAKDFNYTIEYKPGEKPNSEEIVVTTIADGIKQVGTMTMEGVARETSAYMYNKLFTGRMVRPLLHESVYINVLLLIAVALAKMNNEVAYMRVTRPTNTEVVPITEIPSKILLDEILLFLSKYVND
jgi:hypothetical protein|nr:MAG TPA: hypothetical protein [Caudoviricetes sp.]